MRRTMIAIAAAFMLLALVLFHPVRRVLAASGQSATPGSRVALADESDNQSTVFRSATSSADTIANVVTATPEFLIQGRGTISCLGLFSQASQTATIQLYLFARKSDGTLYLKDKSGSITITAEASIGPSGSYEAKSSAIWPGLGAYSGRLVIVTAPAGGTVALNGGSS